MTKIGAIADGGMSQPAKCKALTCVQHHKVFRIGDLGNEIALAADRDRGRALVGGAGEHANTDLDRSIGKDTAEHAPTFLSGGENFRRVCKDFNWEADQIKSRSQWKFKIVK